MSITTRMTHDERRAAIVEAAIKLFAERGFRGTTTRALADAVGVTEPVLYEHFKSKRELYTAIVEAKAREGMARASAMLEPFVQARDDRGLFLALADIVYGCQCEDQAYSRLQLSVALEDPELSKAFYDHMRAGREKLAEYIAGRIRDGAFRPVDPRLAARAFVGMVNHHATVIMLYGDDFVNLSKEQVLAGMVDLFLEGMQAPEGGK